jgi:hypothetical protein
MWLQARHIIVQLYRSLAYASDCIPVSIPVRFRPFDEPMPIPKVVQLKRTWVFKASLSMQLSVNTFEQDCNLDVAKQRCHEYAPRGPVGARLCQGAVHIAGGLERLAS